MRHDRRSIITSFALFDVSSSVMSHRVDWQVVARCRRTVVSSPLGRSSRWWRSTSLKMSVTTKESAQHASQKASIFSKTAVRKSSPISTRLHWSAGQKKFPLSVNFFHATLTSNVRLHKECYKQNAIFKDFHCRLLDLNSELFERNGCSVL